jgi:hypothetical protein
MNKHWQYLKYVLRHKYFVFMAGVKIGCPLWRLISHDMSKFLPSEWVPYVEYFYGSNKVYAYTELDFNNAWLKHQHRNKHHWQYWLLREDSGDTIAMSMPRQYILELVADWAGAGREITGKWDVSEWYAKNKEKIVLSVGSRTQVEKLLFMHFHYEDDGLKMDLPVV